MPVPSIKDTIKRYLRSVRPLLDDESHQKVVEQAKEFENGIAKKLQLCLVLKSWWKSNYVSDWWEKYIYLRGRSSLVPSSNYYGTDYFAIMSTKQSARAATLTYHILQFRRSIERQEMKPIMAQGMVPLCSWQYERMFNTARIPGIKYDKIVHWDDIKHIVVLHKGCYYKVLIHHNGRLLNACEIQYQLDLILKTNEKASHGEEYLASLTSLERTKWAEIREKFFSDGVNKSSLQEVESSAFFLTLDDQPIEYATDSNQEVYDKYSALCLHGKIHDRWFDKSFQICVGSNGKVSKNCQNFERSFFL